MGISGEEGTIKTSRFTQLATITKLYYPYNKPIFSAP
jgi:hypothetical protein